MSVCQNFGATARSKGSSPRVSNSGGTELAQFARLGAFAEQMLVHQNAVVKIREDMPLDKACLIGCGVTTGMGAVFRTTRIEPGSRVCVIGAGGVGLSAVQAARIAGAGRLIVVDITQEKLDLAKALGATDVVNGADVDAVETIKEMTGGGVDYSFEAIGLKATVEQAWKILDVGGTATVIGMMPFGVSVEIPGYEIFMQEKTLKGSMMGSNQFRTDMPRFIDMYLDGRLLLDEMARRPWAQGPGSQVPRKPGIQGPGDPGTEGPGDPGTQGPGDSGTQGPGDDWVDPKNVRQLHAIIGC